MNKESPDKKLKIEIHALINSLDLDANSKQELHSKTQQYSGADLDDHFEQVKQKSETLRQQVEKISQAKEEPHHIGEHTEETLSQEAFSLANTKPAFRDKKWLVKWESISEQINNMKDARIKRRIQNKVKALLNGEQ